MTGTLVCSVTVFYHKIGNLSIVFRTFVLICTTAQKHKEQVLYVVQNVRQDLTRGDKKKTAPQCGAVISVILLWGFPS